jgi:hypothetical protein
MTKGATNRQDKRIEDLLGDFQQFDCQITCSWTDFQDCIGRAECRLQKKADKNKRIKGKPQKENRREREREPFRRWF